MCNTGPAFAFAKSRPPKESNLSEVSKRLLLVGGGHAHVFVLEAFARRPEPGLTLTLVTRDALTPYSGMLPGHLAGLYARSEMQIDLERLALRSGARLILNEAVGFDAEARMVRLRTGEAISYDLLSVDIGVMPDLSGIQGAAYHALAVKPIGDLLRKWDRLVADAARPAGPRRIAIIGGGVAGICLVFAASAFLRRRSDSDVELSLISAVPPPELNSGMRRRIDRALRRRGITVHEDEAVSVDEEGVTLARGGRLPADAVLISTGAAPPPGLKGSSLAKDECGFLAVGPTLQVLNDEAVFAAGDCATMVVAPRPKAGVFAVRQGPVLARNLRHALRCEPLEIHSPQRDHLVLIGTGDGSAIGGRGRWLSFEGRWVWRLKDWLDRRFMRRFQ